MKIIAANRPAEDKQVQSKWQLQLEKQGSLVSHQYCTTGNKKTGENEEIKKFAKQAYTFFNRIFFDST